MTPNYLCGSCDNKDVRYIRIGGHDYAPKMVCDYDMTMFPNAKDCDKYEARGGDDGESDDLLA